MMFYLYVQQNQWIVITLLSGAVIMLLLCLTYQSMWHPRGVEKKPNKMEVTGLGSFFAWLLSFMPWVIILLILGSVFFTIATVAEKSAIPPNW